MGEVWARFWVGVGRCFEALWRFWEGFCCVFSKFWRVFLEAGFLDVLDDVFRVSLMLWRVVGEVFGSFRKVLGRFSVGFGEVFERFPAGFGEVLVRFWRFGVGFWIVFEGLGEVWGRLFYRVFGRFWRGLGEVLGSFWLFVVSFWRGFGMRWAGFCQVSDLSCLDVLARLGGGFGRFSMKVLGRFVIRFWRGFRQVLERFWKGFGRFGEVFERFWMLL